MTTEQAINDARNLLQEIHRMLMAGELEVKALPHHRLTFHVKENLMKRIDTVNSDLVSMLEDPE
jgi:hypothetical protein